MVCFFISIRCFDPALDLNDACFTISPIHTLLSAIGWAESDGQCFCPFRKHQIDFALIHGYGCHFVFIFKANYDIFFHRRISITRDSKTRGSRLDRQKSIYMLDLEISNLRIIARPCHATVSRIIGFNLNIVSLPYTTVIDPCVLISIGIPIINEISVLRRDYHICNINIRCFNIELLFNRRIE